MSRERSHIVEPVPVEPGDRWKLFTDDELIGIGFTAENPAMAYVIEEIEAEMERRCIPWGTHYDAPLAPEQDTPS